MEMGIRKLLLGVRGGKGTISYILNQIPKNTGKNHTILGVRAEGCPHPDPQNRLP